MAAKSFHISLKLVLLIGVAAMGLASLTIVAMSTTRLQEISYENKLSSFQELIALQTRRTITSLIQTTTDLGMDLQARTDFRQRLFARDAVGLQHSLDEQFRQFLVSSGAVSLQRIYVFDDHFQKLTQSDEGRHLQDDSMIMCNALIDAARPRTGTERIKPINDLCIAEDTGMIAVLVTVAKFKPLGYVLIVVDLGDGLHSLEQALDTPVSLTQANGTKAYQSTLWEQQTQSTNRDDLLFASHHVTNSRGETVATVTAAQDIRGFRRNVAGAVGYFGASAIIISLTALLFFLFLLRSGFRALETVRIGAERVRQGTYDNVPETRFHEINVLVSSFNSMAENVASLVEKLQAARHDAERASRAKSTFLANMSHEIRTPMNAILGYAQILGRDQEVNSKHHRAINVIGRSGTHLLELINEVLDISKIEAGKMELHESEFNVTGLVDDLAAMFEMRCKEKGLHWQVSCLNGSANVYVRGDSGKLRQVLINLLGNAVKFTDSGTIELSVTRANPDTMTFSVCDSGPGITTEMQSRIFDAFTQEEQGLTKGGTGLGLAIAKQHVALMGGTLSVESTLRVGTCFHFSLPLRETTPKMQDETLNEICKLHVKPISRALVIDNVASNREVLKEFLTDMGFTVGEADDGQFAVDAVGAGDPHIVFMDYRMPHLGGEKAVALIREHYGQKHRIVMVSASVYDHQTELFAGADITLLKPLSYTDVAKAVAELVPALVEKIQTERRTATANSTSIGDESMLASTLASVPGTTLHKIAELAEFGMLSELTQEVNKLHLVHQQLAGHLQHLLTTFRLDEIVRLTTKVAK